MSNTVKAKPRRRGRASQHKRPLAIWFLIGGVIVVALVIAIAVTSGQSNNNTSGLAQVQPATITGTALPMLGNGDPASDAASGQPIPQVTGAAFDGTPVKITNDGRAKVIFFVAHWCPHCQAEVPVITAWLASTGKPANIDLYAVSTAVSSDQPNYPPSAWLAREKWPITTMADDKASSVATAFGLSAYPFMVAVNANGTVAARTSGELPVAQLSALLGTVATSV